ncbi:gp217 [Sphingomonas phage PAU]|uniref:endolysin n=1 Tax=Sphingomonas phage PAU TaxID=1150991 RepID=UPI0002573377|nr:endolysin [Sphingomonas phage PAU]AFF28215.1 gp217 [Sphingomonas phage PAU]
MFSSKNEKSDQKHPILKLIESIKKFFDFDTVLSIIIMVFILWLLLASKGSAKAEMLSTDSDIVDVNLPEKFNEKSTSSKIKNKEDLYVYMKKAGIKFPELVWSQAMMESAWMNSAVFNRSNNLFGMKKSGKRDHLQIHKRNDSYSHFETIKKCVLDYKLHQEQVLKIENIKNESQYMRRLIKTGYCPDEGYARKILAIRKNTDFNELKKSS